VIAQDAPTRYAGLGWLAVGFAFYAVYRRRLHLPLAQTTRAPIQLGPAIALEYRTILVPIVSGPESHESVDLAARLAAERGATIVALRVIVVPLDQPLDAHLPEQEAEADRLLDDARATAEMYGVRMVDRLVRARSAGRAIVQEAERRQAEIIVLGAPRGRHRDIFGKTVDFVLKNAPCRVMIAAGKKAA
jgi:basic amino acid/polyamine antiporter, APA family